MKDPRNEREAAETLQRASELPRYPLRAKRAEVESRARGEPPHRKREDRRLLLIAVLAIVVFLLDCCHWRPDDPDLQRRPIVLTRA